MTWEDAWREGRTRWDAGQSPPILETLVNSGTLPHGPAVVPGCGSGYDVFTLARDPERSVLGLDLAPTARVRFEAVREQLGVDPERAEIHLGDFFEFAASTDKRFNLAWDYTFFCAIDPAVRTTWVDSMHRLLAPDGELVTLLFPSTDADPGSGPPFPIPPSIAQPIIEARFTLIELTPVLESHPGREGKEQLARWRPKA
ncbi:MAG: methyltransferase domain-containing protein [Sandaracinaceae bacterium]